MDPHRPPTSDLHGALVGLLLAGTAAWLVLAGSLVDWAWDGRLVLGEVGRGSAVLLSASLAGLAAGFVGVLLGVVKRRRVRLSLLAGLGAGQGAALGVAGIFVVYAGLGGALAEALLPLTVAGAALLAVAVVASVMLVPRREA